MEDEVKKLAPQISHTRQEVGFRLTKKALEIAKRIDAKPANGIRFQGGQFPQPGDDVILNSKKGKVVFMVKRHLYDITEDENIVISILLGLREGVDYSQFE